MTINACGHNHSHVVMYMTIVTQMEVNNVDIQLHD